MPRQTLGERVADLLVAEGITKMFSLPEVTFGRIHQTLHAHGVPLIAPHHETVAGYMAEAYVQLTGEIAVVGGSVGPGTINLYPAIANSYSEALPVLYLGSERTLLARRSPRRSQFQCPPNLDVVRPITKYAAIVEDPLQADDIFHEAFRQMRAGTTGPAYIGLPFDMLLEEREFGELARPERYRPATFASAVADDEIERAATLLAEAQLPLVIGGAGVRLSRSQPLLRELVDALGCPVILTTGGRAVLPDTHPQVFDFGIEPGATISRSADVILAVGSSIGEKIGFGDHPYSHRQGGQPTVFGPAGTQRWIHLERDPVAVGRNRPVDLALVGDMRALLPRLTVALRRTPGRAKDARVVGWQDERQEYYRSLYSTVTDATPIHPGRAIIEIQKALPDDVIMVRDGGAFSVWMQNFLHHNSSEYLVALKQGMLGTGVPYAMAAALAAQKDRRRVCLITGDGAFGFYAMEIETAVRYQLPIVIVVGYDQGWSLEVPYYMHVCGRTFEVDHTFVRLDELARVMGAYGEFCAAPGDIAPAVNRAFASGKPAVVQIVIDRDVNAFQIPNNHLWVRWHADKEVYID